MHININDRVTLSNHKKYIVISKITQEENTYYYLVDMDTRKEIKICYENIENQSMIEIKNKEMLQKLFPLFVKKSQEAIVEMIVNSEESK